ncbi:MAG TPA: hypothetical protein VMY42_18275, partial [Thermoguttaceae bacterium]|nr:hypothetical protein [Thermoguttaceae bacterium]
MADEIKLEGGKVVAMKDGVARSFTPEELVKRYDAAAGEVDGAAVTIKVDGREQTVTVGELRAMAEKSSGADARFREAAATQARAKTGLRLQELSERFRSVTMGQVTDAEITEYCQLNGLDAEKTTAVIARLRVEQHAAAGTAAGASGDDEDAAVTGLQQQVAALNARLETLQSSDSQRQEREGEAVLRQNLRNRLTSDPILGKMLVVKDDRDWEDASTAPGTLLRDAFAEVRSRVVFGRLALTPELLEDVMLTLRSRIQQFGKWWGGAGQANVAAGPASSLSPGSLQTKRPLRRPKPGEPGYDAYVGDRLGRIIAEERQG